MFCTFVLCLYEVTRGAKWEEKVDEACTDVC